MILAMTLAQVMGAVPTTRLGKNLAVAALCTHYELPFACLIAFAALAGLINGAAYGWLSALIS